MEKTRQSLRLAALLHDVGHSCFSHAAEKNLFPDSDHEIFSREILSNNSLLSGVLDSLYWKGCASLVSQILEGGAVLAPQLLVLHDIVSGQMDADRADYLLRDSLHCGVDYGRFDLRRLIECLELFEDEELGRLEIAINHDGLHAFEALILARYQMNTQVYYHRLRRIYDKYLTEYFSALEKDGEIPTTPEAILAENDVTMLARIFRDAGVNGGNRTKWARRIRDRNHHRMIYKTGDDANYRDIANLKGKVKKVQEEFPDVDLIHDVVPVNIHKLATPRDTNAQGKVVMRLLGPNGTVEGDVGERSLVLKSIPSEFQCGRIYADVDPEDERLRKEMSNFARNEGY